jgi:hypothetical protein
MKGRAEWLDRTRQTVESVDGEGFTSWARKPYKASRCIHHGSQSIAIGFTRYTLPVDVASQRMSSELLLHLIQLMQLVSGRIPYIVEFSNF